MPVGKSICMIHYYFNNSVLFKCYLKSVKRLLFLMEAAYGCMVRVLRKFYQTPTLVYTANESEKTHYCSVFKCEYMTENWGRTRLISPLEFGWVMTRFNWIRCEIPKALEQQPLLILCLCTNHKIFSIG